LTRFHILPPRQSDIRLPAESYFFSRSVSDTYLANPPFVVILPPPLFICLILLTIQFSHIVSESGIAFFLCHHFPALFLLLNVSFSSKLSGLTLLQRRLFPRALSFGSSPRNPLKFLENAFALFESSRRRHPRPPVLFVVPRDFSHSPILYDPPSPLLKPQCRVLTHSRGFGATRLGFRRECSIFTFPLRLYSFSFLSAD